MRKILIVAQSEFATLVRSKAFMVSIVLMPVIMVLSVVLMRATKNATDGKDRTFAFVDYTGVLGEPLVAVAQVLNAGSGDLADPQALRTTPRFIPVEVKPDGRPPEALRLELSDRVRRQELFAFVELPENLLDPAGKAQIRYYSDHPSYNALSSWLRVTVNGLVLNERFRRASIDRALVSRLTRQAPVENLGLFERDAAGTVKQAEEVDQVRAQGVPLAMLVLMYITVMSSAPQLLNSVIEEKMSRISEVLMGAITPFQLMMGKLIGSVGVSVLLAAIYIAGGLVVAQVLGRLRERRDAGRARLVHVVPRDGRADLRLDLHRDRRGVQRSQGHPEHGHPGDGARHAADVHVDVRAARAGRHDRGGAVDHPDRGAVSDDAAHLAAARPAGVADRALDRAHGRHRRPRHLGRGEGFPDGTADAGEVGHDGGDVAVGEGEIGVPRGSAGSTGFRQVLFHEVPQGSVPRFGSAGFCAEPVTEPAEP